MRCGIAAYTSDLCKSLKEANPDLEVGIVALGDHEYQFCSDVIAEIPVNEQLAYQLAAQYVNLHEYDVLSVQHEYGIFGGEAGSYLLDLVREVNMPIVTTLHTVLRKPSRKQRYVLEVLLKLSTRVVVMSKVAVSILSEVHDIDPEKVDYIPHGIPVIPKDAGRMLRQKLGEDGPIILTFGLLSPDKGIENVVRALPKLVEKFPGAKYLVVGATHPHVLATAGESYRESLIGLAEESKVENHVEFVNEFVSVEKLVEYLSATDFYVTPYLNPEQITSGTLAYSMGAGKVVISTPYEYAKEVLADGRGIIVPFGDQEVLSDALVASWECEKSRKSMGKSASDYGATMQWDKVVQQYLESFESALNEVRGYTGLPSFNSYQSLPKICLDSLEHMTDSTGILQHANFDVPNRKEGYCVDDNARALHLTVLLEERENHFSKVSKLQNCYLAFLLDSFDPDWSSFRNFLSYNRTWLEQVGSEDAQGRALWALGSLAGKGTNFSCSELAKKIFDLAGPALLATESPRCWAYTILGSVEVLSRYPQSDLANELVKQLSFRLEVKFTRTREDSIWPWPEERLAYGNARFAQAMIVSGHFLQRPSLIDLGTGTLDWLMQNQITSDGYFSPIGSKGAGAAELGSVQFDQQPIEVASSVSACLSAFRVTGDVRYYGLARWCFEWFLGGNCHRIFVARPESGACYDGLTSEGINLNQGAESLLSYLTSLTELQSISVSTTSLAGKRIRI